MPRKADADEILEHMQQLPSSLRLDRNRRFWPNWLFRSDHVENATEILNSGRLLSRAAAERGNLLRVDSGSPHYVGRLSRRHRSLVRLYFRPQTPTQYANEGIRPRHMIEYEAHMPVPVYLLFASSLLAEQGVCFTKGRLNEAAAVGDSAEFLKSIDFRDVYHDGAVGPRRSTILNARHSEVVVENELSLDKLKHIVCRSAPGTRDAPEPALGECSAAMVDEDSHGRGRSKAVREAGHVRAEGRSVECRIPVRVLLEHRSRDARAVRSEDQVVVGRPDSKRAAGELHRLQPAGGLFAESARAEVSRSRVVGRQPGVSRRLR